jgi:hypothetical protein
MNHYSHLPVDVTIKIYCIITEVYEIVPRNSKVEALLKEEMTLLEEHYETIKEDSIFTLDEQREKYDIKIIRHKPAIEFDEDELKVKE